MIKDILEKHRIYTLDLELDLLRYLEQFRNKILMERRLEMGKNSKPKDIIGVSILATDSEFKKEQWVEVISKKQMEIYLIEIDKRIKKLEKMLTNHLMQQPPKAGGDDLNH